jgi:spore coat polysaccharide biosynthesis protein SpsF (cytidylyltransferase family)
MNYAIFLTTRLGSSRLFQKALLRINGETVTEILIKRLQKTGLPIILCCPHTQDDILKLGYIAANHGIGFFPGERENIIRRHRDCAEKFGIDWIIEADGDDILACPEVINSVKFAIGQIRGNIPIKTEGLPLGLNVLAYPASILSKIPFDKDTNWGAQITKNGYQSIRFDYDLPYRLSLDYSCDFDTIKDILENCKRNLLVGGICDYIKKHPEIRANERMNEEYWKRMEELSK